MAALTKANLKQVATAVDTAVDAALREMLTVASANTGASVADVVAELLRRREAASEGDS